MKKLIIGFTLFLLFGASDLSAQLLGKAEKQVLDCRFVSPIQQAFLSQHVNEKKIGPELEKKMREQYMKRLDPNRMYLLASDVAQIEKNFDKIFEKLKSKDCSSLNKTQEILVKRVKERAQFANQFLSKDYKFDSSVELKLDRDKGPYPKTEKEAQEYLAQYIHFQIANYLITETPIEEAKENVKKNWDRTVKKIVETKEEELVSGLLDAFGRSLDPHTAFMARDNNEDFKIQMSLSLEGIGATLSSKDGFTVIEALVPGGPAAKSGLLQTQDRIVSVGQGDSGPMETVMDMDLKDVVRRIRGTKGTKVRLTIMRREAGTKKTFTATLVRDRVKLEDDAASLLTETREFGGKKHKFGIINLPSFYNDGRRGGRSSSQDVKAVIKKAKKEGVQGLLIDLSTNGGGSLDDAIKMAGLFIKTGNIVKQSTKEDPKGAKSILADTDADVEWSGPLVILVSRASASASEIVAGSLQDYKRALVVGADHTFGKGTIQTVIDIPPYSGDLGAIKVTIGTFFIPGGYSTQHRGVLSDVVLPGRFDGEDVGEKMLDYSLSPAQLTPFLSPEAYVTQGPGAWSPLTPETIKVLAQKSKGRVEKDPEFKKLKEDIEKSKKMGKVIKLSDLLNDKDKDKETEKKEKQIKSGDKAERDKAYLKRPELQESLNILADLVEHTQKSPKKSP